MAEFNEVIRQWRRLCSQMQKDADCSDYDFEARCENCPVDAEYCKRFITGYIPTDAIKEVEDSVMAWAADNPEPVLPTWTQWQKKMFPNAVDIIGGCAFDTKVRFSCAQYECCGDCRDQPIPADIAEKLGIKPDQKWGAVNA